MNSEAKSLFKKPLVGKDSWRSGLQGSVAPSVSGSEVPKVLIINTHREEGTVKGQSHGASAGREGGQGSRQ